MFEDAEKQLDAILKLVAKCPVPLQEKCFEILLHAYVDSKRRVVPRDGVAPPPPPQPGEEGEEPKLPGEVAGRFRTTAKRLGVDLEKLAGLFDFHSDPFTFHALHVPGKSKAEQTRNVGLLVAMKSYLTTGHWEADMKEVRARCVDQNCYDKTNFRRYLGSAKPGHFKVGDDTAMLTPGGVKAAEALLTHLASAS